MSSTKIYRITKERMRASYRALMYETKKPLADTDIIRFLSLLSEVNEYRELGFRVPEIESAYNKAHEITGQEVFARG